MFYARTGGNVEMRVYFNVNDQLLLNRERPVLYLIGDIIIMNYVERLLYL